MRKSITTLLTAAFVASGATAAFAVEARQGESSLRTVFNYYDAPGVETAPPVPMSSMPLAGVNYQTVVTDEGVVASPAAPMDSAACGCAEGCGCETGYCSSCGSSTCGCNNGCSLLGDCCLGEPWLLQDCLTPCCDKTVTYGGWIEMGYYNNNERLSFAQSDGLAFRDYPNNVSVDQAWVYVEKLAVSDDCCGDWGYRFDAMYGVDAQFAQSYGNPRALDGANLGSYDASLDHGPYGWAFPQAYVQYAKGDWSWKIGRWFTPVGYEVIPATGNFFYSHTLTHFNSEPFGHTGALGAYTASDCMTYYTGWALGWDTGFDLFDGGNNFIGGFTRTMNDDV